ncbi:MAG: Ig-like domain repeat protein [Nocardioidaceae bacterium]
MTVHAVGGSGGSTYNNQGGRAADVTAQLAVAPGETLHVHVAGNGSTSAAGANGGGATGWTNAMGAGGGASDVRVGGDDLASRVLVAAGGGGADQSTPGAGGDAGAVGTDGIASYCGQTSTAAQPGAPTAGGAGGVACNGYYSGAAGSLGQGGAGSTHIGMGSGGGGGGGYYGGGGGGDYQGGAGGSSYLTPGATGTQSTLAAFGTPPSVRISWVTPPAASVGLTVADSSLPADGTSTTAVTAAVADQYGNATPGDTVVFTSDDPGVTFGSVTDRGDGTYSTVLTASHAAHSITIQATDGTAQGSITITQTPLPQDVQFTSTPPGAPVVGASYDVAATGGASGNPVVFSTTSAACSVTGATVTLVHAGPCTVYADQAGDGAYSAGHAVQMVTIGKASTAVTFTSPAPADAVVGQTYAVTTAGSGSSQPVVLTIDSGSAAVCSIDAATVSFTSAGTCTVAADQAGDSDYEGSHATQDIVVSKVASVTTVAVQRASAVAGQPTWATATVSVSSGRVAGTVQFRLDGRPVGAPLSVASGTASAVFAPSAGAHAISATFIPSDPTTTSASTGTAALLVDKAATTTALSVTTRSLTATITAVAPGAGSPTGKVTFTVDGKSVGTATLSGRVATLRYSAQAGTTRHIAALYAGDANFVPSAASTARRDPTITAKVTSAAPRTRFGWYHAAVSVSFECKTNGAPLTVACPGKVVLRRNVAARTISRTIQSTDGGMDTVTVQVSIDRTAPGVQLQGIANAARYFARAPHGTCTADDSQSGVLRCVVTRQAGPSGSVRYTALATDRAGNKTIIRGRYTVVPFALDGARYVNGAYTVKLGRSYALLASSQLRPRYIDAAPSPRRPSGNDNYFHRSGSNWALGIAITRSLRSYRYWNIGVKVGRTLHVLKIRVVR